MKKTIVLLLTVFTSLNIYAQPKFPFDVKVSGYGNNDIIFIPGLSSSGSVWDATAERYSKDYKCHVLTFHGFAGVAPDDTTDFRGWENSVAQYIIDKKISKPIIIGHSIGGGLALLLAADYPSLISKIVVVDALPCLGAIRNPAFVANPHPDCTPFIKQFTAMTDQQFYSMQKQTMPSLLADTVHLNEVLGWSVKSDRKTMAEIYCQFLNTDMRPELSKINCPSLVLLEHAFVNIKPTIAEQYKGLRNAQLEYSTKGLHFIMYDDTDWYMNQLDQFLK